MRRMKTVWKAALMKAVFTLAVCTFAIQSVWADSGKVQGWYYPSNKPQAEFPGEGSASAPFMISCAQDLANLAWLVNNGTTFEGKYFRLTTDIKLNELKFDADGNVVRDEASSEWVPIGEYGTFWNSYFKGVFDGNGHKIEGLNINVSKYDYGGLFGCVDNAIIRNLTIDKSYLYSESYKVRRKGTCAYGMLVGYFSKSQLKNCHITNSVINAYKLEDVSPEYFGGLVGQGTGNGMTLTSCSFDNGKICVHMSQHTIHVGGMMGEGAATYNNCKVNATIDCEFLGGYNDKVTNYNFFSGFCYEAENITNCTNNVSIKLHKESDKNDRNIKQQIYANSLCYTAKDISQTSSFSQISLEGSMRFNRACLGNVIEASSVSDCAFYTKFDCSKYYTSSYPGIYSYPIGGKDIDLGWKYVKKATNVAILNDNTLLKSTSDHIKCYVCDPCTKGDDENLFIMDSVEKIKQDFVFSSLNKSSSQSVRWGKIDGDGEYAGCPLPVACGGKTDANILMGDGTRANPYLIGTPNDLSRFATAINMGTLLSENTYFQLSADIDMSASEAIDEIGNSTNSPFLGTFDGNGHVISNISYKGAALFGYLYGTVENLAVVGIKNGGSIEDINKNGYFGGIAKRLGSRDPNYTGTIENCYVGGEINVNIPAMSESKYNTPSADVGGLCSGVARGNIKNSYFKGHITLSDKNNCSMSLGGITGSCWDLYILSSYASFGVSGNNTNLTVHGITGFRLSQGKYEEHNCYSVCDQVSGSGYQDQDGYITKNDKEIYKKIENDNWLNGVYRPILKNARHYEVTAADGSDTKAYYDAIPMLDNKNTNNDIYHYALKEGDETDQLLWSMPNLAIYNAADQSDYILNCTLDPSQPFGYTKKGDVEAVKANMHYPLALTSGQNYYMLCLPGAVTLDALPESSKLYIAGKVNQDNKYMNVVEADSVPAGVPFIAWIPTAFTQKNTSLDIVMRSQLAVEPVKTISYATGETQELDLAGTYKEVKESGACTEIKKNTEGNYDYLASTAEEQSIKPFTSYLKSDSDVKLLDYPLLSETAKGIDKVLEMYDNKEEDVILERQLRKDAWNTICLPFDMSKADMRFLFGYYFQLEELSDVVSTDDGGCQIQFTPAYDGIKAGKCYLIKPSKDFSVGKIEKCTISNKLNNSERTITLTDGASATIALCGTFSSRYLGNDKYAGMEDGAEEYFLQGNKIYHAVKGHNIVMNGFRFYITANEAAAQALSRAIVVHGDGTTTSLRMIEADNQAGSERIYDLQGVEHDANHLQRGVYIKGGHKYVK